MPKKKNVKKTKPKVETSIHTRIDTIKAFLDKETKDTVFAIFEAARQTLDKKQYDENVQQMRKRSGEVNDSRTLVTFLYLLMRDEIPAGRVERIMLSVTNKNDVEHEEESQLTNGWLAKYAQDITDRLLANRNTGPIAR